MKFTPTPEKNTKELKDDLQEFGHKLRLLEHFNDDQQQPNVSLVKNKSNFVPPLTNDKHLQMILENISSLHDEETHQTKKSNINCLQRKALESLKNNEHIIIGQADKGGATVIMDKQYYKERIVEMLSDREAYAELTENEDKKMMKKISHLTKVYKQELTKKEIDYLQNFALRTSNLYGLSKIHKSREIASAINKQRSTYVKVLPPTDLPFRPIVAGPTCPTHCLSNFIDILLKPLCKHTYRATFVMTRSSLTTSQRKLKKPPY